MQGLCFDGDAAVPLAVFVLCPMHWYQAPASLKLMIDRLVCADGGNPDPTTTKGKNPLLANMVMQIRSDAYQAPNAGLHNPKEK